VITTLIGILHRHGAHVFTLLWKFHKKVAFWLLGAATIHKKNAKGMALR
jgi:hypothetical protein